MTQEQLAIQAGYSGYKQIVSAIECGRRNLTIDAAEHFASVLGVLPEWLLCKPYAFKTLEEQLRYSKITDPAIKQLFVLEHINAAFESLLTNALGFERVGYISNKFDFKIIEGEQKTVTRPIAYKADRAPAHAEEPSYIIFHTPNGKRGFSSEDIDHLKLDVIQFMKDRFATLEKDTGITEEYLDHTVRIGKKSSDIVSDYFRLLNESED